MTDAQEKLAKMLEGIVTQRMQATTEDNKTKTEYASILKGIAFTVRNFDEIRQRRDELVRQLEEARRIATEIGNEESIGKQP